MEVFTVRELKRDDAEALLAFELINRAWFESQIDARHADFYSLPGVATHIEAYLSGHAGGTWHPFVIADARQRIVGRANLKAIDALAGTAEVGYRIDQHSCGQGLATRALRHLIEQARQRWQLRQLAAWVYPHNAASRRVIERCGFVRDTAEQNPDSGPEQRFILTL